MTKNIRKISFLIIAATLFPMLLSYCRHASGEDFVPSDVTGDVVDRVGESSYRFRIVSDSMKGKGGDLEYIMQYPVFEGEKSDVPNAYVDGVTSGFLKRIKSDLDAAESGLPSMNASLDIAVKRFDDEYLSLHITTVENMGGSHENASESGAVFLLSTGKRLSIGDITDPDAAAEYFISEIEKSDKADMLFEGYQDTIRKLVQEEGAWYLDKNSIVLICPPYLIAPYAAGGFNPECPIEAVEAK